MKNVDLKNETPTFGNTVLCAVLMEVTIKKGAMKWKNFERCNKKVKHKVTYKEGLRGKMVAECLCGRHFVALKKRCDGAKKRYNYDAMFESEEI